MPRRIALHLCVLAVVVGVSSPLWGQAQRSAPVSGTAPSEGARSRVMDVPADATFARALLATLQDRGYRPVLLDLTAGRAVATRLEVLRIEVTWRPEGSGRTRITASAFLPASGGEATPWDAPDYYERDLFLPLASRLGGAPAPR